MEFVEQYLISLKAEGRTRAMIAWHRASLTRFTACLTGTGIVVEPSAWTPLVLRQYIVDLTQLPSRSGATLAHRQSTP